MQVYNCDETGISIVHKPGKVVAELGRRHVYALTSAECGKTHTVLSCVSASGYTMPPMMVYPRKKAVPEQCKAGALPCTLFASSSRGWINTDLFLQWFSFFLHKIPSAGPILLVMDGHASHVSMNRISLSQRCSLVVLAFTYYTHPTALGCWSVQIFQSQFL